MNDAYTVKWNNDGSHCHPYLNQRTIDLAKGTKRIRHPRRKSPAGERFITYSLDTNLECGCRLSKCIAGKVYGAGEIAG